MTIIDDTTKPEQSHVAADCPNERLVSCDLVFCGEGIGYITQYYYDAHGNPINEFDVLKVLHFIGARYKRHYMYKWVRRDDKGNIVLMHLTSPDESVPLSVVVDNEGILKDAEIVQSNYS